jgi:hypothetical protein
MPAMDEYDDRRNNNMPDHEAELLRKKPSCSHEHFEVEIINEIININIDDIFTHLFSDSELFRAFVQQRQTYDVKLNSWSDEPDSNGVRTRIIYYTLSINYAIGPKSSASVETQMMLPETVPGSRYVIDADCVQNGVPYGDNFSTLVRYCMTKIGPKSTRLYISGKIVYKKRMWGLMKNFLEKTANAGMKQSFGVIVSLLRLEAEGKSLPRAPMPIQSEGENSPIPPPRQRTSRAHSRSQVDYREGTPDDCRRVTQQSHGVKIRGRTQRHEHTSENRSSDFSSSNYSGSSKSTELLAIFIFITVLILVGFHVIFYMQLYSLENTISKVLVCNKHQ